MNNLKKFIYRLKDQQRILDNTKKVRGLLKKIELIIANYSFEHRMYQPNQYIKLIENFFKEYKERYGNGKDEIKFIPTKELTGTETCIYSLSSVDGTPPKYISAEDAELLESYINNYIMFTTDISKHKTVLGENAVEKLNKVLTKLNADDDTVKYWQNNFDVEQVLKLYVKNLTTRELLYEHENPKEGISKRKLTLPSESFNLGHIIIDMLKSLINKKEFSLLIKKELTLASNQQKMIINDDAITLTKKELKLKYFPEIKNYLIKVFSIKSFDDDIAEIIFLLSYEDLLWQELIGNRSIYKELDAIKNSQDFLKVKQRLDEFLENHCMGFEIQRLYMSQKGKDIKIVSHNDDADYKKKKNYYTNVFLAKGLADLSGLLDEYIHCFEVQAFIQNYTLNQHKGIKNIINGTIKGIGGELIDVLVNHKVLNKIKNYPDVVTISLNPEYKDLAQYITPVFPRIFNINALSKDKIQYQLREDVSKPKQEIHVKKIMKKSEIKEKFNLKLLGLDQHILENSTIFTLDYDIIDHVLEVFLKVSGVLQSYKFNGHDFLRKLEENEKYESIFRPHLNDVDYKIIECFSGLNFKKGFENTNPIDIQFYDFLLKMLFDFDQIKNIPYFEKNCPKTLNKTEKQEWLNFPFDRFDSGFAKSYNKTYALNYFLFEYINVLSYLLNFDYFIFPLSLDLRGRGFPLVGLFSPYIKFIFNQLQFYEYDCINEINQTQFTTICKLFKDNFATSNYISFEQDLLPLFKQDSKKCVITQEIMEKLPIKEDKFIEGLSYVYDIMNYYYKITYPTKHHIYSHLPSKIKINLDVSSSALQNIALLTNWFEPAQDLGMVSLHDLPKNNDDFFSFFYKLDILKENKNESKIRSKNKQEISKINEQMKKNKPVNYRDRVDIKAGEDEGENYQDLYTKASTDLSSYVEGSLNINKFLKKHIKIDTDTIINKIDSYNISIFKYEKIKKSIKNKDKDLTLIELENKAIGLNNLEKARLESIEAYIALKNEIDELIKYLDSSIIDIVHLEELKELLNKLKFFDKEYDLFINHSNLPVLKAKKNLKLNKPNQLYCKIIDILITVLCFDAFEKNNFLDYLKDRKLGKYIIMTLPYGSKLKSHIAMVEDYIYDRHWSDGKIFHHKIRKSLQKGIIFISKYLNNWINKNFESLMFLKKIVTQSIKNGKFNINPFETPFISFLPYQFTTNKKTGHVIKYKCRGKKKKRKSIRIVHEDNYDWKGLSKTFLPNVIQAIDAYLCHLVKIEANKHLNYPLFTQHDCFWTTIQHALTLKMTLRQGFRELANVNFMKFILSGNEGISEIYIEFMKRKNLHFFTGEDITGSYFVKK